MNIYEELGKLAAYAAAGITPSSTNKSSYPIENPTSTEQGVENILPALSLGGSTASGVDQLRESTLPK